MSTAAAPALTTWTLDATHTDASFAVKHLMISTVRGRFAGVSGTVQFDPSDLSTGQARIAIDVASIDTREEKRDAHLKSADFFEVEKYPTITFVSRRVEGIARDRFTLVGDLTIKDVTREVALAVESHGLQADPWGGQRAGFSATLVINRKDFGLTWNVALEAGGVLVGEDVKITLDVQLVKAA